MQKPIFLDIHAWINSFYLQKHGVWLSEQLIQSRRKAQGNVRFIAQSSAKRCYGISLCINLAAVWGELLFLLPSAMPCRGWEVWLTATGLQTIPSKLETEGWSNPAWKTKVFIQQTTGPLRGQELCDPPSAIIREQVRTLWKQSFAS